MSRFDSINTELLIIQPTSFCNLDCRYCYLPGRAERGRITPAVLEAAFSKVLPSFLMRQAVTVLWHAGEPLTLPPSWYEDAFRIAEAYRPPSLRVEHHFQTNGSLLDAAWLEFLKRTGARIGLSIDGPADLHDANRRTRAGGKTHIKAMRALRMLQSAGIHCNVISVLTRETLAQPDRLFDFYRDTGIHDVSFNVEEREGVNHATSLSAPAIEQEFSRFFRRFLERMRADPTRLTLRELRTAVGVLRADGMPAGANQESEPLRILTIGVDGSVSTFSPEFMGIKSEPYDDFVFGNIVTDSLATIVARVVQSRLHRDIVDGLGACARNCAWFKYCGGGSPSNKYFENGSVRSTETLFCRLTRQTLLDAVLDMLEQEMALGGARR